MEKVAVASKALDAWVLERHERVDGCNPREEDLDRCGMLMDSIHDLGCPPGVVPIGVRGRQVQVLFNAKVDAAASGGSEGEGANWSLLSLERHNLRCSRKRGSAKSTLWKSSRTRLRLFVRWDSMFLLALTWTWFVSRMGKRIFNGSIRCESMALPLNRLGCICLTPNRFISGKLRRLSWRPRRVGPPVAGRAVPALPSQEALIA